MSQQQLQHAQQHVQQEAALEAGQDEARQRHTLAPEVPCQQKPLDSEVTSSSTSTDVSPNADVVLDFETERDLEQGGVKPKEDEAEVVAEGRPRCGVRSARARKVLCCTGALTALVVGATLLLWPRAPDWHLVKVDMDTSKFVAAMTGQGNVTEPLPIAADVRFSNPNFVGASTERGTVQVYYGSEVMCHGTVGSTEVGPRSDSGLRAHLVAQFNDALAEKIKADVLSNNFQLKVTARAHVVVPVAFLRVKVAVHCELTTDALKVLDDPAAVVSEKKCSYGYSM
jgi:hypothetical protein